MIGKEDILNILGNPWMHEDGCFWIFESSGVATQIKKEVADSVDTVSRCLRSHAIWIRDLERYSDKMLRDCKELGAVNCHVILAPKGSQILGKHTDPWDVYIKMLRGKRTYSIEDKDIILSKGEELTIYKGQVHGVVPIEDSVTINYGIEMTADLPKEPEQYYCNAPYGLRELFEGHSFFTSWED